MAGKFSFQRHARHLAHRIVKTGFAMGVVATVAFLDGGFFSPPATFAARLGIDRYQSRAADNLQGNLQRSGGLPVGIGTPSVTENRDKLPSPIGLGELFSSRTPA